MVSQERKRERKRNKEEKLIKERKEGRRKKRWNLGRKKNDYRTSETISLERKAIGKLQIPLRPSRWMRAHS